jgi:hypothetical protein
MRNEAPAEAVRKPFNIADHTFVWQYKFDQTEFRFMHANKDYLDFFLKSREAQAKQELVRLLAERYPAKQRHLHGDPHFQELVRKVGL